MSNAYYRTDLYKRNLDKVCNFLQFDTLYYVLHEMLMAVGNLPNFLANFI